MGDQLDRRHLETVARILEAIVPVESETARAAIAVEDAYVALSLGLALGLSPAQVAKQHDEAMRQLEVKS